MLWILMGGLTLLFIIFMIYASNPNKRGSDAGPATRWRDNQPLQRTGRASRSSWFDRASGVSPAAERRSVNHEHAVVWLPGSTDALDLNTMIDPAAGWVLKDAWDINDAGQIIGRATSSSGAVGFYLLTPVRSEEH